MITTDVLELGRRNARQAAARRDGPPLALTDAAAVVAYLGAAPLVAGALVMVAGPTSLATAAREAMIVYGAALLIFFGGVRWGVAVMKPGGPSMRALFGAAAPLLAALPLFAAGPALVKIAAIMTMMILLLADDLKATRRGEGAPAWYLGVRTPLTVLIEVAFLIALAATLRG